LFEDHPGRVAALILEPVKNDEPRDGFLERVREITRREGCLLIFDEMISGMRFDLRGAHHRYGVYPDLACYGKAISNGYSFSLLAGRRDVMELGGLHHDRQRVFLLSQTHASETAGLVACKATLEECRRVDVTSHIWATGAKLVAGLRELAQADGVADTVRIIGFDCNPQLLCTHPDGTYWPELHTAFHQELISFGILLPWTTITYSHGEPELEQTFAACQEAMRHARRALEDDRVSESFEGEAVKPVFRRYNYCRQSVCGLVQPEALRLDCCRQHAAPAGGR
jgi:glutamate-1-semialdehyde 2,1-aminomutase